MDYHHCIVPSHKNSSSGLTYFCAILRHDGQHPPFVYTDSYNVTVHAQMMETSKQVVRWEKCFFKWEIGSTSQEIGGSLGKVGDLAALRICLCMHMYMCAGVFLKYVWMCTI